MEDLKFYERQDMLMGTVITQRIYGENAESAAMKALEKLKRLESEMSFFKTDSTLSKINTQAGLSKVKVSQDIINVLLKAVKYGEISEGAFDVTAAPVIKSWGIFTKNQRIPSSSEIQEKLKLVNYKDIEIDEENSTVKLKRKGQMLDFGGIAKGYAGDKAIEIYKECGITSAFINLGGNVVTLGKKPDDSVWKIGIQNPDLNAKEYAGIVSVEGKTVVTSGGYQRFFIHEGEIFHHIIDPHTGYPSKSDLTSATIVSHVSVDAEGLSTPAFIMGLEASINMISKLNNIDVILITKKNELYITKPLEKHFQLTDKSMHLKIINC